MNAAIRNFWTERRPSDPPANRWWDYLFVAVLAIGSVIEAIAAPSLVWRPVTAAFGIGIALLVLVRRSHPLLVIVIAATAWILFDSAALLFAEGTVSGGGASPASLVLIYAVARWASGPEVAIGVALTILAYGIGEIGNDELNWIQSSAGVLLWLFPTAIGIIVRYRANLHEQRVADIRLNERQQLARELHDMVAHYVSAIAIQAQAGQAMISHNPAKANEILEVIEETASTTLDEMRRMVGILRNPHTGAETAPQAGLPEIHRLADTATGGLPVDVTMSGHLDDLPAPITAGLYRLAQEAVTNARRHARHATRIAIDVVGDAERVWLTVTDDGDTRSTNRGATGYGLVGMTERAVVLGGTLRAEPAPDRGWVVEACLPLAGATS